MERREIFILLVQRREVCGNLSSEWESIQMVAPKLLWAIAQRAPRLLGRALVKAYRYTLSPLIGFHCRHLPTCSDYADEALDRHGLWRGGWMVLARILRCHPFGTSGLDFVPKQLPPSARWYLPWRYGKWSWSAGKANRPKG
jgi:putative membrane protein insertion efficiency factor